LALILIRYFLHFLESHLCSSGDKLGGVHGSQLITKRSLTLNIIIIIHVQWL